MEDAGKIRPRRNHVPEEEVSEGRDRSFTAKIAVRMVAFALCAAAIIAFVSFLLAEKEAERALLAEWRTQIEQRGRYESQRFLRAEALTERLAERFLENYADPQIASSFEFDAYFEEWEDGTVRLRPEFYFGFREQNGIERKDVSGFIAQNRPPLGQELRRRLILAYEAVAELGPGASAEFATVHASLPENALIIHWPEEPWGLNAASDLDMTALSVLKETLPSANPKRRPVWTGLYFDATASEWTVTFQRPVDWQGRHLINPSVDVRLTDLIGDVVSDQSNGVYDLILSREGMLVAHPGRIHRRQQNAGQISIDEVDDPAVASIYRNLAVKPLADDRNAQVAYIEELDAYVASVGLQGPDWWLVTVYPQSIVADRALRSAVFILLVIALSFGAFILTVVVVLRSSVAAPIREMTAASRRLVAGDYVSVANGTTRLPTQRDDEIGTLARSFRRLAQTIDDMRNRLEQAVTERTIELELANQQLAEQSLRDGLTNALNRRAFDQDLEKALRDIDESAAGIALALFDADFFKAYNDHHGHVAGDTALERIVAQIDASLPRAKVYRYGGEELAALIPSGVLGEARAAVKRTVQDVADLNIAHSASPFGRLTISAGVILLDDTSLTPAEVLTRVDQALYAAKAAGRNRSL